MLLSFCPYMYCRFWTLIILYIIAVSYSKECVHILASISFGESKAISYGIAFVLECFWSSTRDSSSEYFFLNIYKRFKFKLNSRKQFTSPQYVFSRQFHKQKQSHSLFPLKIYKIQDLPQSAKRYNKLPEDIGMCVTGTWAFLGWFIIYTLCSTFCFSTVIMNLSIIQSYTKAFRFHSLSQQFEIQMYCGIPSI